MPRRKDWAAAEKAAEAQFMKAIRETMSDEVYPIVVKLLMENVDQEVYGAYSPRMYERREGAGGMADPSLVRGEVQADGTMRIYHDVKPKEGEGYTTDKSLPQVVETGQGYDFMGGVNDYYLYPRPYIANTFEDVDKNRRDEIMRVLARGVARRMGLRTPK